MEKHYDEDLRNKISMLPTEDKLTLIESLFTSLVSITTSYYYSVGMNQPQIAKKLSEEVEILRDLVTRQYNLRESQKSIHLESDPNIPTDKHFVFDAKTDFDRIMRSICSKSI